MKESEHHISIEVYQLCICHQRCFSDDTLGTRLIFLVAFAVRHAVAQMYSLSTDHRHYYQLNVTFAVVYMWKEAIGISSVEISIT